MSKPGTFEYEADFAHDRTIESMAAEQRASNALTAGTHVAVPRELLEALADYVASTRSYILKHDGVEIVAAVAAARAILDAAAPDDLDEMVEPKSRASGILNVMLKYGGRGNPMPYPPPWEERDEP